MVESVERHCFSTMFSFMCCRFFKKIQLVSIKDKCTMWEIHSVMTATHGIPLSPPFPPLPLSLPIII